MISSKIVGRYENDIGAIEPVTCFDLTNNNGMTASIFDWGGVLAKLEIGLGKSGRRNLVLGFRDFADYPEKSPYFGATIGRFGNRIGGASFALNGKMYNIDANEGGTHQLHGGRLGFGRRRWQGEAQETDDGPELTLSLRSVDGDQGYPGNLDAGCTYKLGHDNCLTITMQAVCDQPTPINLVHHSYWNLDGQGLIDRHQLQLNASHYLPTGSGQIPTGEVLPVEATRLDFRQMRQLDVYGEPNIDNAFILDDQSDQKHAATLVSSDGLCRMDLETNQPAVQCYTAFKLNAEGANGEFFYPRSGICLETEAFPDAPNKPNFPNSILRPGEIYVHQMKHQFQFG